MTHNDNINSSVNRCVGWTTDKSPANYMINYAGREHFKSVLNAGDWLHRRRGIRCNASCCSHAELDACETLERSIPAGMILPGSVTNKPNAEGL